MKSIFLAFSVFTVSVFGAEQVSTPLGDPKGTDTVKTTSTNKFANSQILNSVFFKTEWRMPKNPFRFEISDNSGDPVDHTEQMQLIGISKMPAEDGVLRTYAFITKTSETKTAEPTGKAGPGQHEVHTTSDTYVLQSFPEILDESTTPTEEQAETSSITLTSEQLWFVGAISVSNRLTAVFWPYGSYPVKEEALKQFDLVDGTLKDIPMRRNALGEKIGGNKGINVLARITKAKLLREAQAPETNSVVKATPAPMPKTNAPSGNITKDVECALKGKQLQ